jgi:signal transduction histidine kinase
MAFGVPGLVEGGGVEDVVGEWLFLGGVWLLGRWVRQRRRRTEDLEEHAAVLEADRAARARAAVTDERARIAREMHDSVAHSVSVMVLQAAAEQVLTAAPERARASLLTTQDSGRDAIDELRRMMLEIARARAEGLGSDVDLRIGDAQALDFADASFDTEPWSPGS